MDKSELIRRSYEGLRLMRSLPPAEQMRMLVAKGTINEKGEVLMGMCQHPNARYYGDTDPPTYKCDDCGETFVK